MNIPNELVNRWADLKGLRGDFVREVVSKNNNRAARLWLCWFVWLIITTSVYTILTDKMGAPVSTIGLSGLLLVVISGVVIFTIFSITIPKISKTERALYRYVTSDYRRIVKYFGIDFSGNLPMFQLHPELEKHKENKKLFRGSPHAIELSIAAYHVWRDLRSKTVWIINQQHVDSVLKLPNVPDKYKKERREIQDMLKSAQTFGLVGEGFSMSDLFSNHGPTW